MTQLYFHCSSTSGHSINRWQTPIMDLAEARDHAALIVQLLVMDQSPEDWRDWILHVSDDLEDEVFSLPFSSVLGKPH
jgi:hypothetical protein